MSTADTEGAPGHLDSRNISVTENKPGAASATTLRTEFNLALRQLRREFRLSEYLVLISRWFYRWLQLPRLVFLPIV